MTAIIYCGTVNKMFFKNDLKLIQHSLCNQNWPAFGYFLLYFSFKLLHCGHTSWLLLLCACSSTQSSFCLSVCLFMLYVYSSVCLFVSMGVLLVTKKRVSLSTVIVIAHSTKWSHFPATTVYLGLKARDHWIFEF